MRACLCPCSARSRHAVPVAQVLLPWNAFITASDYFGRVFLTVTTCVRMRAAACCSGSRCGRFENYFSVAYLGSNCIGAPSLNHARKSNRKAVAKTTCAQGSPSSYARRLSS